MKGDINKSLELHGLKELPSTLVGFFPEATKGKPVHKIYGGKVKVRDLRDEAFIRQALRK